MISRFKEIIEMCERRGYLKSLDVNKEKLKLGPVGCLLQENLKTEWLNSNLTNREISVFLSTGNTLEETYKFAKDICLERVPFGIAQISDEPAEELKNDSIEWYRNFYPTNQVKLEAFTFVSPSTSTQHFHKWQRLRRMWWRKFSAFPGRYELSDIKSDSSKKQTVEITSAFSWGSHVVENITVIPTAELFLPGNLLLVKDNRKQVQAQCIKNTAYLSTMVLNILCDAYDDPLLQDSKRPLLRFHRKIAPYKMSFAISTTKASNTEQLNDLALYLCKKLRAHNVSVLLLPTASRSSLESQWSYYDQLGVPYSVILNDNTLKNGIAHLRNRDTTLKEQIHVSDLTAHVEKLFKNY